MAIILRAHATKEYYDDDYEYHAPTVMGKCSNCCNRIEVEMDDIKCPKCGAKFDTVPKEMLTQYLPLSV